uniref:BMERB domain-containing protein n=1 Tax=Rhabditophanes sp. KR3021 TaxID=114890 RepID=A0AC35U468_9BILA
MSEKKDEMGNFTNSNGANYNKIISLSKSISLDSRDCNYIDNGNSVLPTRYIPPSKKIVTNEISKNGLLGGNGLSGNNNGKIEKPKKGKIEKTKKEVKEKATVVEIPKLVESKLPKPKKRLFFSSRSTETNNTTSGKKKEEKILVLTAIENDSKHISTDIKCIDENIVEIISSPIKITRDLANVTPLSSNNLKVSETVEEVKVVVCDLQIKDPKIEKIEVTVNVFDKIEETKSTCVQKIDEVLQIIERIKEPINEVIEKKQELENNVLHNIEEVHITNIAKEVPMHLIQQEPNVIKKESEIIVQTNIETPKKIVVETPQKTVLETPKMVFVETPKKIAVQTPKLVVIEKVSKLPTKKQNRDKTSIRVIGKPENEVLRKPDKPERKSLIPSIFQKSKRKSIPVPSTISDDKIAPLAISECTRIANSPMVEDSPVSITLKNAKTITHQVIEAVPSIVKEEELMTPKTPRGRNNSEPHGDLIDDELNDQPMLVGNSFSLNNLGSLSSNSIKHYQEEEDDHMVMSKSAIIIRHSDSYHSPITADITFIEQGIKAQMSNPRSDQSFNIGSSIVSPTSSFKSAISDNMSYTGRISSNSEKENQMSKGVTLSAIMKDESVNIEKSELYFQNSIIKNQQCDYSEYICLIDKLRHEVRCLKKTLDEKDREIVYLKGRLMTNST